MFIVSDITEWKYDIIRNDITYEFHTNNNSYVENKSIINSIYFVSAYPIESLLIFPHK